MSIKDHIEAPVEEPDLLGAGERTEEGVPLTGHLAGPVLAPAKLPLLLPAPGPDSDYPSRHLHSPRIQFFTFQLPSLVA